MDWGLFDKNAGDNRYLREEIVYSRKVHCSIVFNLLSETSTWEVDAVAFMSWVWLNVWFQ